MKYEGFTNESASESTTRPSLESKGLSISLDICLADISGASVEGQVPEPGRKVKGALLEVEAYPRVAGTTSTTTCSSFCESLLNNVVAETENLKLHSVDAGEHSQTFRVSSPVLLLSLHTRPPRAILTA